MIYNIQTLAMPTEPIIETPVGIIEPIPVATSDWRRMLPVLHGAGFHLRELRRSDAASLLALLTTEEVARFITPPPTSVEGFERFIEFTRRQRGEGRFTCFAVVPQGFDTAVGIFQLRSLNADFSTAEWGFALGSPFWGTGLFPQGAELVLEFAFEQVGVNRLEARAMTVNGRGNGALHKLGARKEGVLRGSFAKGGRLHDEHLWAILERDWRCANGLWRPSDAPIVRPPRLSESLESWEGILGESVH